MKKKPKKSETKPKHSPSSLKAFMSCTKGKRKVFIFGFSGPNQTPHSNMFFRKNLTCAGSSLPLSTLAKFPILVDLKTGTPSES